MLAGKTVHIPDVLADPEFTESAYQIRGGFRSSLGVPLLREGRPIGVFVLTRPVAKPFTDTQIDLVTNFAAQAVIAIENVRLFDELRESLQQQTATADVLEVISSSPGELEPVFHAMLENATRICGAQFGNLLLYDGDAFRFAAVDGAPPAWDDLARREPVFRVRPNSPLGRLTATRELQHIADVRHDEAYVERQPATVALAELAGARTLLVVPMLKEDKLVGSFGIYRQEVQPFTDKQIAVVENFAAQAVIAIENTRLLNELRESLQQQTATADVLKVISRSAFDLQAVLDTLVQSAAMLCEADIAVILRQKGAVYQHEASHGYSPELHAHMSKVRFEPGRGTIAGRTALEGKVVQVTDILDDREFILGDTMRKAEVRTMLGVPLLREGIPIGIIVLMRRTVRRFSDRQIDLATTFADQAVIAIENVRLFDEVQARTRDLSEALEQQTATSEVLRVISSSPGELEPVFQAMLANAVRICDAKFGYLQLHENGAFRMAAMYNPPPTWAQAIAQRGLFRPGPLTNLARVAATKQVVHTADYFDDPAYKQRDPGAVRMVELAGARTVVGVPMLKEQELIGTIHIFRQEVRPFTDKQIELVKNFAAQAVIAIENARLLNELRERTDDLSESLEQQIATSELLRVIAGSPTDLQPVLNAVAETAARICGANDAMVRRVDGNVLRLAAQYGTIPSLDASAAIPLDRGSCAGRSVIDRQTIHIRDMVAEHEFPVSQSLAQRFGYRTVLATPLLREGVAIGTILIRRLEVRPFTDNQTKLLETFASQAVIAIENVRLFEAEQQRTRELSEALEQQTATAEVLGVISSSPGELSPVFEAMLANAIQLCGANFGILNLDDGEVVRIAAVYNVPPALAATQNVPFHVHPKSGQAEIRRTKRVVHIDDIRAMRPYLEGDPRLVALADLGGARTTLAVPMLKEGALLGSITIYRQEVRPFTTSRSSW